MEVLTTRFGRVVIHVWISDIWPAYEDCISVHKHTNNMSKPTRIHARFQSHTSSKLGNEKGSGPCEIPYLKEGRDANLISARKGKVRSGDAKKK